MKSCVPKCHQRALLKVGNLEASTQSQDVLTRYLSLGAQSSPLVVTRCGLRRKFHQPARCSWTKALTLPRSKQRGGVTRIHVSLTQCELEWDFRHLT